MRTKKRINLGLLFLVLLAVGATAYSVWQDRSRVQRVESTMSQVRNIQETETSALIFPEAAIVDQEISDDEMAAQQATLRSIVERLYAGNESFQKERFNLLDKELQRQAANKYYLRSMTFDWNVDPRLAKEDGLLKLNVDELHVTAEIFSGGTVENFSNTQLGKPFAYLFQADDLTLIDQTSPLASRFFDRFLPGDNPSFESEMPWNRSF